MKELRATFSIHRNDMRWECMTYLSTEKGPIEWFRLFWTGYNDDNWWDNVAPKDCIKEFTGEKGTKKKFKIDYHTMLIEEVTDDQTN